MIYLGILNTWSEQLFRSYVSEDLWLVGFPGFTNLNALPTPPPLAFSF